MWVEPNGRKFRIRDMVNGKKETVESGLPTEAIAKKRMQRLEIEKIDLGPVKAGADKANFGEWSDAWWKGHARTLGSAESKRTETSRFKRHVVGRLGGLAFREVDHAAIRRWLDELAQPDNADYDPLSAKSILNVHGYLYMCLEVAVRERMIRSNPCGDSALPTWDPPEMRFLTERELAEVMAIIPVQWRALAYFIAGTGCRVGEALGLKQRHVDVLGGRVRFETQRVREGGRIIDVPLKTKASKRTVGIAPSLRRVLAELAAVDEDAYVFLGPGMGLPVDYETFREMWQKKLSDPKSESKGRFKGLRIHDLRHTHAAHLISRGRPLTSVQRRLGHSSIKVTSDTYGHLLPEVEDDTAAVVEDVMGLVDLGGIVGEPGCDEVQSGATGSEGGEKKPQVEADSAS